MVPALIRVRLAAVSLTASPRQPNRHAAVQRNHEAMRLTRINALLVASVVIGAVLLAGCNKRDLETLFSKADAQVSNFDATADVKIVNGEPDAGYTVTCTVTNVGQAGIVEVEPWISCSEGEWKRSQRLNFNAREAKNLSFFFHEPTVNATNCHGGVSVSP